MHKIKLSLFYLFYCLLFTSIYSNKITIPTSANNDNNNRTSEIENKIPQLIENELNKKLTEFEVNFNNKIKILLESLIQNKTVLKNLSNKLRSYEGFCTKTLNDTSEIFTLAVLADGNLASGHFNGKIKIWSVKNGKLIRTIDAHNNIVMALYLLPDGNLVSGSDDKIIKIWNVNDGKLLKSLKGHKKEVSTFVSLSNNNLASGSFDNTIKIWDLKQAKEIKTLIGHEFMVTSLNILPNGNLVSGSQDKTIKIWSLKENKELLTLYGHKNFISSLIVLSNDYLISAGVDGLIKKWNLKDGIEVELNLPTDYYKDYPPDVNSAIILPNGNLATALRDNTVRLFDLERGKIIKTFIGHKSEVSSLVILHNGDLASASYDSSIKIWK